MTKASEHLADRRAHRFIARQDHGLALVIVQPDRKQQPQLPFRRLMAPTGSQTLTNQMQLSLGHRALQAQHQPRVVIAGVIDAVTIADQRVGQRAQVHQVVPVSVSPRQPRDLDPEHQPDTAEPDFGNEPLKPAAVTRLRPPTTQVIIDHDHPVLVPPEQHCPLRELILQLTALDVPRHLPRARLADVHNRKATQLLRGWVREIVHYDSFSSTMTLRAITPANSDSNLALASSDRLSHSSCGSGSSPTARSIKLNWTGAAILTPRNGLTSTSRWQRMSGRA